ncbi:MAG: sugar phosphate nucleotidyltransferase [Terrimicrobiaceae bacterium]|nr:sugar phosphate nucleotidyltransferase [Terrimicrobiaceae bacterium]
MRAFVLGAGLGTRLRPLTEDRPKPLVPLFDRPLVTLAFAHLAAAGAREFVVNTHHLPAAWSKFLGERDGCAQWNGLPIRFRHEPVLLDTGGGIKNCEDLLADGDFWVHNGDLVADLDLAALKREHFEKSNVATLGLRSAGGPPHVGFDPSSRRVVDIRGRLGASAPSCCLFTGISMVSPRIFPWIPAGRPVSIIPVLLELIAAGERVGGVLLDEGLWMDLGSIETYKAAHHQLLRGPAPGYLDQGWPRARAESAVIGSGAEISESSILGAGCRVGAGAKVEDSLVWPGAEVAPGVWLRDCIVRGFAAVSTQSAIL